MQLLMVQSMSQTLTNNMRMILTVLMVLISHKINHLKTIRIINILKIINKFTKNRIMTTNLT